MTVKLFKNLYNERWIPAIIIMFLMLFCLHCKEIPEQFSNFLLKDHISFNLLLSSRLLLNVSIVFIVVYIVFFYAILNSNKLLQYKNYTGLLYTTMLISVWRPGILSYSDIISLMLLLYFIHNLFKSEKDSQPIMRMFDSAFYISTATIIELSLFPYIILLFVCLLVFRQSDWRLWASTFIGLLLPHVFFGPVYYFIFDNVYYLNILSDFFLNLNISYLNYTNNYIFWIGISPFALLAVIRIATTISEKNIIERKKILILFWILFISIFSLFSEKSSVNTSVLLVVSVIGFMLENSVKFLKEKKFFVILTDVGILTIIAFNFFWK